MKRPRKPADVGPGITRLPAKRTYRGDSAEGAQELARLIRECMARTFDGAVGPAERLARRLAPPEPGNEDEAPARGTVAWISKEIIDLLDISRKERARNTDHSLIRAFEAGQWYGHLLTKLGWEGNALRGERVQHGGRKGAERRHGEGRAAEVPIWIAWAKDNLPATLSHFGASRKVARHFAVPVETVRKRLPKKPW